MIPTDVEIHIGLSQKEKDLCTVQIGMVKTPYGTK